MDTLTVTEAPRAADVMTRAVVTVLPDTPVLTLARLMAERGISSTPVVDASGTLVGLVSEADLIRRLAADGEQSRSFVQRLFANYEREADRYARAHGRTAADVMTRDVVTVWPETPLSRVAQILAEKNIRRVPVVSNGRLLGIVSRADLLRALIAGQSPAASADDAAIREALAKAMRAQPWVDGFYTFADVEDGVVILHGFVRSDAARRALVALARDIPGVGGVEDRMAAFPREGVPGWM